MARQARDRAHPVYGEMATTIFEHMSGLARQLGAINLGQGFPDAQGPAELLDAAARALHERSNQYPPMAGLPELRQAVADFYRRRHGLDLVPEGVIVTSGATEGLAAAIFALVRPGDEVLLFEPVFDAYLPLVRRAGGVPVFVSLRPPHWRYDRAAIEAAISERTRVVIVNDPLNPAGTCASAEERTMLADICVRHDLTVISDEVWEEVRFDGGRQHSLLAEPGMAERTVKIGSAGKIFGLTGWKVGWMCAAPSLAAMVARAHQFITFTTPPALQWAVAQGLAMSDDWFAARHAELACSRDRLKQGLEAAGYAVLPNAATWFLCVDLAASGIALDDREFSERALHEAGVASIPVSRLYETAGPRNIVRFCFTKEDATLDAAVGKLAAFRAALLP